LQGENHFILGAITLSVKCSNPTERRVRGRKTTGLYIACEIDASYPYGLNQPYHADKRLRLRVQHPTVTYSSWPGVDMLVKGGKCVCPNHVEQVRCRFRQWHLFQVVLQKVKHFDETTVNIELADACLEGEAGNSRPLGKKQKWDDRRVESLSEGRDGPKKEGSKRRKIEEEC